MLSRVIRAIGALAGSVSVTACSIFGSAAVPEPDYSVVFSEPPFELRDYDELVIVKTPTTDGSRAAFGRLFEYISGANSGSVDIAMTAPVLNTENVAGTTIAMTAPVIEKQDKGGEMAFILPEKFTQETAPVPTDPQVQLATVAPRRVAVVRYSGSMSRKAPEQETRLREWVSQKDLTPQGPTEVAGYNPPWTLPAYRRNEVLIPVAVGSN